MRQGKDLGANFFWPLAVLAIFVIGLLVAVGIALVGEFDIAAKQREESIVNNGIAGRVDEIASSVLPQLVWDDAVRHLDNSFDLHWATDNIGTYLNKTSGFDDVFVLDGRDSPIFAASGGTVVPNGRIAPYAAYARSLIGKVRAQEKKRGRLPAVPPPNGVLAKPIQSSTIGRVHGQLAVVVATLIEPDFGTARPRGDRAPIALTAMYIDDDFLKAFADRFLLRNVHVHRGNKMFEKPLAHAPLIDIHGDYVATLEWSPENPGRKLLDQIALPIVNIVAFLAVFVGILYRRSRRMAQGLIASEARAAHMAYHDALTGLPNRTLFFDRLGHALDQMKRNGRPLAVHCIDLDRFKEINDTFGHNVGDELIQAAAHRMAQQCRSSETFARLSGDEFAIVQSDASSASAATLAARLCQVMAEPFNLSAGRVFVGCSVGISITQNADVDAGELLRQADLALYRSKREAKGHFCFFEEEMDAAVKTRRSLEADLRDALARDELQMVYQPQVNGRGLMTGVEALVRWQHPTRGEISPAFFVPIAEQSSLIMALGLFTLRRAFADSRRWPNLKVAVNVSANQIRMKDFVATIGELVEEMKVDPRRFELELTEGVLLRDDPDTQHSLRQLRNLGFSLTLDDFGTGYSSLSYLQRYPISKIKIDRSFIANLGVDAEAEAVVSAIVKLARALKLAVIAEGVETSDQLDSLTAAGCSDVQGYLFSRPIAGSGIDQLYKKRRTSLNRIVSTEQCRPTTGLATAA
ncbi:periplasmic sensor diguanylate cyclase/phosphodiesterase [Sphingomonas sp. YR710]|uniref:bifunctional diguanylate cyclase/phosphodiesterase n=1 Tax=Sphingomonas sp. YR710 TaxID=1882773 RepID=UPI00087FF0AF|nr:EAL domain-containing protein [Sphingomonas sp. YR710]SDC58126.1 periplasmic sensor diguanylate cyclase/phosphodiesterase [Sphingomonas sp. YR710]